MSALACWLLADPAGQVLLPPLLLKRMPFPRVTLAVLLLIAVFASAPAQEYWIPLQNPTSQNLNRLSFLDSVRGWVAGDSGTIFKTTSGGHTWMAQDSRTASSIRDLFMLDDHYGWALAHTFDTPAGTLLLKTTNGGNDWISQRYQTPGVFFFSVKFLDRLTGWMGGDRGALVGTTDGGETWFNATVDSSIYLRYPIANMRFFSPRYGYAVGGVLDLGGVVWRTTNSGQRWIPARAAPAPIYDVCFWDSSNVVLVGGEFDLGAGIGRTTDAGLRWEYRNLMSFGEGTRLSFRTALEGWASLGFTAEYMYTLDSGKTWSARYTPDSTVIYDIAFPDTAHGYMVGAKGTVLTYNTSLLEARGGRDQIPSTVTLSQNFPNPVNPSTTFTFTLPRSSFAVLKVYDLLGRDVATLVNEWRQPGTHTIRWNAGAMASGVYLYRLSTMQLLKTRKLVIVR